MKHLTTSEKETFDFAKKFAQEILHGGDIVGLIGDLGAGKTIFSKGIGAGLGVAQNITSPTFVVMKIYDISNPSSDIKHLCHIDAYRLKKGQDLVAIGVLEYFDRTDTITVIEWANYVKDILPKRTKFVKIKSEDNKRLINY